MSRSKEAVVTVRLDAKLDRELGRLSKSLGQSKSDIARDALKRQVALLRFRKTREAVLAETEPKTGVLTDEDICAEVS
jgi:predicted transcriptional regulator